MLAKVRPKRCKTEQTNKARVDVETLKISVNELYPGHTKRNVEILVLYCVLQCFSTTRCLHTRAMSDVKAFLDGLLVRSQKGTKKQ